MPSYAPATRLATHEVANQPDEFAGRNLYATDTTLKEAALREGGAWLDAPLGALGAAAGSEQVLELGAMANRHPPELTTFDRYGRRIDEVRFHPAYHSLMVLAMEHRIHDLAWAHDRPGGHVETRLGDAHGRTFGTFSERRDLAAVIDRQRAA